MWAIHDLEDFIPGIVTFSVDFYNALFVSLFMSNAGSMVTSVLFISMDLLQVILELREEQANARNVLKLLYDRRASREQLRRTNSDLENTGLIKIVLSVTNNLSALYIKALKSVRLWACLPHPLGSGQKEQLCVWEKSGLFEPKEKRHIRQPSRAFWKSSRQRIQISPAHSRGELVEFFAKPHEKEVSPRLAASVERSKKIVVQGLQLLFHCEYLVLVEYVEVVIPLVFATYRSVLVHLPNIVYYPSNIANWGLSAVINIVLLSVLELGSFVFFETFLRLTDTALEYLCYPEDKILCLGVPTTDSCIRVYMQAHLVVDSAKTRTRTGLRILKYPSQFIILELLLKQPPCSASLKRAPVGSLTLLTVQNKYPSAVHWYTAYFSSYQTYCIGSHDDRPPPSTAASKTPF
ncbi:unnamed protein product [Phytophthora fragariaefolia]|uniref:Unnamed protein product n=1 Tax=Phytophthora fragariaefolia TaxID=1490495 RepID=A0A9W6Y5D6_9STRA|nr:unnamed protein product [Phytophthora fragariaefolia]